MESISKMVQASRAGDTDTVTAWLDAGGDPNQHDSEGWTPLLAAAVRGCGTTVAALLAHAAKPADSGLQHSVSGALPVHFAGHSGDVETARLLLDACPKHLDEPWLLNGHTLLLQAVFYGHRELAAFALTRGANTAATTMRGLGPMELAKQFQNKPMIDLLGPYDKSAGEKAAYYRELLEKVKPVTPPAEAEAQKLSDELVAGIESGLRAVMSKDGAAVQATLDTVRDLVELRKVDVNRLGGPLRQPPLIVTVTGNNGDPANPEAASLRNRLAAYLLEQGASPIVHEHHPMGAQAVIRACVFNHLDILKMMGERISAPQLADALNEIPVVNGLTALHDSVLRAAMAGADRIEGYLSQIRWAVDCGARWDLEDFSGRTQRAIAESIVDPERRALVLDALGIA